MGRKKQLGKERRVLEQAKQIQNQRNYTKKALIIGAASLIGCAILGYNALQDNFSRKYQEHNANTRISFLEKTIASPELIEARANSEKRQQYLDNLLTNSKMPYVSAVIYDERDAKLIDYYKTLLSGDNLSNDKMNERLSEILRTTLKSKNAVQTPEIFDFNGQGIKPPIFVRSKLFRDRNLTDEEIKHIITVHEARHAEQFAMGLKQLGYTDEKILLKGIEDKTIDTEILYGIDELDCLNQELLSIELGKSKVNRAYYENTLKGYRMTRRILTRGLEIPPGIQRDFIEKALSINPPR
ncbi:MAG: hypothetical protein AABX17_00540 [Nanoarchaeota archaeon]